jgi:NAD(P)-dependent dehydrogenase (short-subunit alcohol dehydrogenase family)
MRLGGRSAFITGAAKGIGLSVAKAFSKEGATVALADMSGHEAIRQASEIEAETGNKALGVECDVADKQSVENAIEETVEAFGTIDTLACMAATMTARHDVVDLSEEDWE